MTQTFVLSIGVSRGLGISPFRINIRWVYPSRSLLRLTSSQELYFPGVFQSLELSFWRIVLIASGTEMFRRVYLEFKLFMEQSVPTAIGLTRTEYFSTLPGVCITICVFGGSRTRYRLLIYLRGLMLLYRTLHLCMVRKMFGRFHAIPSSGRWFKPDTRRISILPKIFFPPGLWISLPPLEVNIIDLNTINKYLVNTTTNHILSCFFGFINILVGTFVLYSYHIRSGFWIRTGYWYKYTSWYSVPGTTDSFVREFLFMKKICRTIRVMTRLKETTNH